jgi:Leucine-rich repeat (LRR) protein
MNKLFSFWVLLSFCFNVFSQKDGKYSSFEDALKNPESVFELTVEVSNTKVPKSVNNFINLKVLNLNFKGSSYDINDVIEKFSQLDSLEEIRFYGNAPEKLPISIVAMKGLKKVILDDNMSSNLSYNLKILIQNEKIEYLGLKRFNLKKLPDEILEFHNLKGMDLSDNPKLDFNQAFELLSKFKGFESLDLSWNNFNEFPESIIKIEGLKYLTLELLNGNFNTPETYIILSKLENLEYLNIEGNFFKSLPVEIGLLKNLKVLCISGNGIVGDELKKIEELLPNTEIRNELPF